MALLDGGVFDEVRENVKMPYVRIGELHSIPKNTHTSFGREVSCTIHTWTNDGTNLTAARIADQIQRALDHRPRDFEMPSNRTISIRLEFDQALKDPKPHVRHFVQRFRITTTQLEVGTWDDGLWDEALWGETFTNATWGGSSWA